MNESLVQWTLLNNIDYLSEALNFEIASKRGQEITTDYGRIDFIVEDYQKKQLIVELETILNNKNKLDYCLNQILNYKNVSFSDKTGYCILYASETKQKSKRIIDIEAASNLSSVDMTNEQKKVLLRVVTNGNWTAHKVNIYWFLRFIEVNNGEWLPTIKDFDDFKLDLVNGLFGVSYKNRTMYEFLNFACNWCMELGLVRLKKLQRKIVLNICLTWF
jgi:hypothetical protein